MTKLFLDFFDLTGSKLLTIVEESTWGGKFYSVINDTCIALILKCSNLVTFNEFIPISLCILVYKITSKVISLRNNPLLQKHISIQQFGFLENLQILDSIGIAKKCLRSVKLKTIESSSS